MDIRSRFAQLQPRERALIVTAAGLALLTLVVTLGIRPLADGSRRASEQIAEKEALLAEIERVAARLGPQAPTGAAGSADDNQSLVVLVDRTTRGRGLGPYLKRNEPDGTTSIRLRFENAPFDMLLEWLVEMQNDHQVMTLNASIDPGQDTGRVNCSLQLSRTPSP
jgi:type II secretory pathway component PulM